MIRLRIPSGFVPHKNLTETSERYYQMVKWAVENIDNPGDNFKSAQGMYHFYFGFKNEEDALIFRLRWDNGNNR